MADDERPRPSSPSAPQNEQDAAAQEWSDDDEAEHLDPSNKGKGKARQLPRSPEPEKTTRNTRRRRASSLWSSRNSQYPHNINPSLGAHTALNSQDSVDVVPLDDIAATPTPSPTRSEASNPFTPDPFSDAAAVMSPSADPPPPTPQLEKEDAIAMTSPQRPALLTASSSIRRPPTPKPLGLPPPRAPPPPLPQNTPPPETRWWHEWLCGFGEGSDRGGDNQAGRTNPFE
ncbi:hypothetical protein B0H11DRAFT_2133646 [Mycena galericulata]|nr:hypothetical protein B0H11DRAFT_2133646 [Mycena galericulata]